MSWWPWSTPQLTSHVYPHAIVNLNVSDEALAMMPRALDESLEGITLAAADVLRDQPQPRPVLYFSTRCGLSEAHGRMVAHELSHVTAKLLGIKDRTHETDGGRW